LLQYFENRPWPVHNRDQEARAKDVRSQRVDVAAKMRAMWR